jgi:signal transduction histidine kinase
MSSRQAKISRSFARIAALITIAIAVLVLAGWALHLELLKRIHPSFVAMSPSTAVCFIALSAALLLLRRDPPPLANLHFAKALSTLILAIGAIKLIGYITHIDLPIDRLLFPQQVRFDPAANAPSRMAPNTALNCVLVGLSLILLDSKIKKWRPAQYLAIASLLISLTAILGYAYRARPLYGVGAYIPMALHTAAGFLLMSLSILAIRPNRGVMSVIASDSDAGAIARRLLPIAILMPAFLGFLWLFGRHHHWYEPELGVAFGVVITIALLITLVAWNAGIVFRADARRHLAQSLLEVQNQMLEETARSERSAHEALKHAQAGLVQTEKLASLGQMVAGIAHEINNPLAFVANNVAVLHRDIAALKTLIDLYRQGDPPIAHENPDLMAKINELSDRIDLDYTSANIQDVLSRSNEGLSRIQRIVNDLRDFARLDEADVHEADLNAGIESTVNIIRGRAKKKDVEIRVEPGQLPPVECQPAKINQVVMNLLSNAIDAAPQGGWVKISTYVQDNQAQIEVTDNGPGIPDDIRHRIFDPFFTTKPPGEGTGLGLSIAYGIIKDHAGQIQVLPGPGGHFSVTLPLKRAHDSSTPLTHPQKDVEESSNSPVVGSQ